MANWGIRTYFIQVLQALWAFCFVSRYDPRLEQMGKLSSNQTSTSWPGVKNIYTSVDCELHAEPLVAEIKVQSSLTHTGNMAPSRLLHRQMHRAFSSLWHSWVIILLSARTESKKCRKRSHWSLVRFSFSFRFLLKHLRNLATLFYVECNWK